MVCPIGGLPKCPKFGCSGHTFQGCWLLLILMMVHLKSMVSSSYRVFFLTPPLLKRLSTKKIRVSRLPPPKSSKCQPVSNCIRTAPPKSSKCQLVTKVQEVSIFTHCLHCIENKQMEEKKEIMHHMDSAGRNNHERVDVLVLFKTLLTLRDFRGAVRVL